jgi:SpoVK/Ycf46/Vps4 family AAA+-type ATPase
MGNANNKNKNQQSINENMPHEKSKTSKKEIQKKSKSENADVVEKIKKEYNSESIYQSQNLDSNNERNNSYYSDSEESIHPMDIMNNQELNPNIMNLAQSNIHHISPNDNKNFSSNIIRSKSTANPSDINQQKDILLISNIFKKCDENINQANNLIKSNKTAAAVELLKKAESVLLNLKEILNKKTQINSTELSKINNRLEQSMIYINKRIEFCDKTQKIPKNIAVNSKTQLNPNVENKNKEIPDQITKPSSQSNKIIPDDIKSKILSEIMEQTNTVKFDDIIGMNDLKQILREIIILPQIRPDIFTGLRTPPKGLLLFGPPGTGKTFIAKAVASECNCTFFNISASSLTSKWLGESEKLVRALFEIAKQNQPSIIFFDEIESILSKRTDDDNEASKRIKTEFFIQFDGMQTTSADRVLLIAATNRPQDLDSAILRRLAKRVYVGPLDLEGRKNFIYKTLLDVENVLNSYDYIKIANLTENYSNSDLKELCREAAFEPFRELNEYQIRNVKKLRPIQGKDFAKALNVVRGSLSNTMMKELIEWNKQYGQIG